MQRELIAVPENLVARVPDSVPLEHATFATLGAIFDVVGTAWNVAVAWFAGTIAATSGMTRVKAWLERAIGALFIGVGVRLALAGRE